MVWLTNPSQCSGNKVCSNGKCCSSGQFYCASTFSPQCMSSSNGNCDCPTPLVLKTTAPRNCVTCAQKDPTTPWYSDGDCKSSCSGNRSKHVDSTYQCQKDCPARTFEDSNHCYDTCPDGKINKPNSQSWKPGTCETCTNGFEPNDDKTACICPHDHFKDGQSCLDVCPDNKVNVAPTNNKEPGSCQGCGPHQVPNSGHTACVCDPAKFQGPIGQCLGQCGDNDRIVDNGAGAAKKCEACPEGTHPSQDKQTCVCNHDRYLDGSDCLATCSEEKINVAPVDNYSPGSCQVCENGYEPSSAKTECICPDDKVINDGKCDASCPDDKVVGPNRVCQGCPANYDVVSGACVCKHFQSGDDCLDDCPVFYEPPAAGSALQGTCVETCPKPKVVANEKECLDACPTGTTVVHTDGNACEECPTDFDLVEGQCVCDGYISTTDTSLPDIDGTCVAACAPPKVIDGHYCLDSCPAARPYLLLDGTCTDACPDNNVVKDGACQACDEGETAVGDECVCTAFTTAEGACVPECDGLSTPAPAQGQAGTCVDACPPPSVVYGNQCLDSCPTDSICTCEGVFDLEGRCVEECGEGQIAVNGRCGACEKPKIPNAGLTECVCPDGMTDLNGQCVPVCLVGHDICGMACKNLKTDTENCGACDAAVRTPIPAYTPKPRSPLCG
jgi:hypothetical protein